MRAALPGQRLAKSQRLIKPGHFQAVYQSGRKAVGRTLILWSLRTQNPGIRLGVVASLKVGDAVRRNRARRLMREVFRRERASFSGPADVVLVARKSLTEASMSDIRADLLTAAHRARLLPDESRNRGVS